MGFSPKPHATLVHWVSGLSSVICQGLLQWLSSKNWPVNAGATEDPKSIPGSGRSLGGGNGNPLQNSCLENSMDTRAWQAIVYKVTRSQTERLSRAEWHRSSCDWCDPLGTFKTILRVVRLNEARETRALGRIAPKHTQIPQKLTITPNTYNNYYIIIIII